MRGVQNVCVCVLFDEIVVVELFLHVERVVIRISHPRDEIQPPITRVGVINHTVKRVQGLILHGIRMVQSEDMLGAVLVETCDTVGLVAC